MHNIDLNQLILRSLGNHRGKKHLLQADTFPGLSIDNVAGTPSVSSGSTTGGLLSSALPSTQGGVDQQVSDLSKQLGDLKTTQQNQLDQLTANTQALQQNTTSRSSSGSSSTSAGGFLSSFLSSGFGLSPIFEGLFSLFGSGSNSSTATQSLTPFSLPSSIQYAAGLTGSGAAVPLDTGQGGQLRSVAGPASPQANSQPATSVQINVNAMDSQSFMDHSEQIAQAVRSALLNSSSLNDVISSL